MGLFTEAGRRLIAEKLGFNTEHFGHKLSVAVTEKRFVDKKTGAAITDDEALDRYTTSSVAIGSSLSRFPSEDDL